MIDDVVDGKSEEIVGFVNAAPLLVDVDHALLCTELPREAFWAALGHDFNATLRAVFTSGATSRQAKLAVISDLQVNLLPLCPKGVEKITKAVDEGRTVTLFSAADQSLVEALAGRLGLGGDHLGVQAGLRENRTEVEQAVLHQSPAGFDLLCGPRTSDPLYAAATSAEDVAFRWSAASLVKELRPHQWAKNGLLLLPLIAAQMLFSPALFPVLLAILAFSAGASAIYGINDFLDLSADRQHPQKRFRPVAAGALPIRIAFRSSLVAAGLAIVLGGLADPRVAGLVVFYMLLSLIYSLHLKSRRWVDLGALVALFLLRVAAGAVAAGVAVSPWLALSVAFFFFTLAIVKRLTALVRAPIKGRLLGRGYDLRDMQTLYFLGLAGAILAVAAFLTFSYAGDIADLYTRPWALRLAALPVALWLVRMVRLAVAGQEDFDPLVFVAHDRGGLMIVTLGIGLCVLAL